MEQEIKSILDLGRGTIGRILKRMKATCAICGWNEARCDIHHIVPKSKGGTNDMDNLICVCPNCHRLCHSTDRYSVEFLKERSLGMLYKDWRSYYRSHSKKKMEGQLQRPADRS